MNRGLEDNEIQIRRNTTQIRRNKIKAERNKIQIHASHVFNDLTRKTPE